MRRIRPRSRRRRDTESPLRTTAKGLAVVALLGIFVYVGVTAYNGVPLEHYQSLTVEVPQVGNLVEHDPVRIAGVPVGQVVGETITHSGQAKITLQIDPGTQIPAGTQAMVRANGLLGARYVQLILGPGPRLLPSGATIIANSSAYSFGVPEVLATLDPTTRTDLAAMTNGLGIGLLGHGEQLNTSIHEVTPAAFRFKAIMQSLTARPGALAQLFPSLDSTMATLDGSRTQIAALLAPASQGLNPFATQRVQLRQALTDAPSALGSAKRGLGSGESLLASASALAEAASRTLPLVTPGLRNAALLLNTASVPLDQAAALLGEVQPAVPATLNITHALLPSLPLLRQALTRLAPMLVYAGQRACDIENFGVTMRSMTGYGGTGTGPVGPPMEFRAQVLPAADALAPIGALDAPLHRAYAPPCTYVDRPASANPPTSSLGAKR